MKLLNRILAMILIVSLTFVGITWSPKETKAATSEFNLGDEIVRKALSQVGKGYTYGGGYKSTESTNYDCSGLVSYCLLSLGYTSIVTKNKTYTLGDDKDYMVAHDGNNSWNHLFANLEVGDTVQFVNKDSSKTVIYRAKEVGQTEYGAMSVEPGAIIGHYGGDNGEPNVTGHVSIALGTFIPEDLGLASSATSAQYASAVANYMCLLRITKKMMDLANFKGT